MQLQGPGISRAINPAFQNGTLTRVWIDRFCIPSAADPTASSCVAGDLIPQGDPTNPSPNGELLSASGNVNFGTPELTTFYDQEWANGWGQRFANWEFSGGVQHELTDGLSVKRQLFSTDLPRTSAARTTSPSPPPTTIRSASPRRTIHACRPPASSCATTTRSSRSSSASKTTSRRAAINFGTETRHWNGVDLTVAARMDNGLLLQGGMSTGRASEDDCDLAANLDNPSTLYCAWERPFLTQGEVPRLVYAAVRLPARRDPSRASRGTRSRRS